MKLRVYFSTPKLLASTFGRVRERMRPTIHHLKNLYTTNWGVIGWLRIWS